MTTTSPLARAGVLVAVGALVALTGCGTPDASPPAEPAPTTVVVEAVTDATDGPLPTLPSAEEVVANRDPEHPIDGAMGNEPEVMKDFPGMTTDEVLGTLGAQIRVGDVGRSLGELAPADYADVGLEDGGASPVIFMLTPRGMELAQEVARLSDLDAEVRLTTVTGAALAESSGLLNADEALQALDLEVRERVHGLAVDVERDDHAAAVARVRELHLPAPSTSCRSTRSSSPSSATPLAATARTARPPSPTSRRRVTSPPAEAAARCSGPVQEQEHPDEDLRPVPTSAR